jgi:hypothetical protein
MVLPTARLAKISVTGYAKGSTSLQSRAMSKSDIGCRRADAIEGATKGFVMADVTIVYWRDIPAQVIVGKGRRGVKRPLPERFEQAIDRCAMKTGAAGTDAYLAEWRKADAYSVDGEDEAVATAEAARLDAEYDKERIIALIANDGWL